jgi:hypothetical protein
MKQQKHMVEVEAGKASVPNWIDVAFEHEPHGGGRSRWQEWKQEQDGDDRCPTSSLP